MNLFAPKVRELLIKQAVAISSQCDGLYCNMAHLAMNNHFAKKWRSYLLSHKYKRPEAEFWLELITTVKEKFPSFIFIAENYSSMFSSNDFISLGFDYVYEPEWERILRTSHLDNLRTFISMRSSKTLQTSCFRKFLSFFFSFYLFFIILKDLMIIIILLYLLLLNIQLLIMQKLLLL